jgi:hypothetical protein
MVPVDHDPFASTPTAPTQKFTTPSMMDKVKDVLAEPFRLGAEAVTAPINSLVKAGKGIGGLYSTGKSLIQGDDLDTALQKGTDTIGNRNVVSSPLAPSKTGQFLSEKVVAPAIDSLSNATGQPELVRGVAEAAGDIASLYGIKPGVSAAKGAIGKALGATELPEKLYASAAKLPLSRGWTKTIGEEVMAKRKGAIKAGLEGEVPISEQGIIKAKNLELAHRNAVDEVVNHLDTTGTLIPKEILRPGLSEAYKTARTEGTSSAKRFVDNLYDKRFEDMGTMVKTGEKQVYDPTSGGNKTVPVYERQYKPSEIQEIKRHLYKQADFEKARLSRGLASQMKELATKGMAHEAKDALEELANREGVDLAAMNKKDAAYINLKEALERAVPRIGNKDMMGLGAKVLLTGTHPWLAIIEHAIGLPAVKGKFAFAINRARQLQGKTLAKQGLQATSAGLAATATQPQTGMADGGTIPGKVVPGQGDVKNTPTEPGEYITPVDAIIAKGYELSQGQQLSDIDAYNLGKQWFDQETMRLKQMMGNPTPPNNAGVTL